MPASNDDVQCPFSPGDLVRHRASGELGVVKYGISACTTHSQIDHMMIALSRDKPEELGKCEDRYIGEVVISCRIGEECRVPDYLLEEVVSEENSSAEELDPVDAGRLSGVELIAQERLRQIDVEGWSSEHDDKHSGGELAKAAACYALPRCWREVWREVGGAYEIPVLWPFDSDWWKPSSDRVPELVKAGAMIAAEIDRLERMRSSLRIL